MRQSRRRAPSPRAAGAALSSGHSPLPGDEGSSGLEARRVSAGCSTGGHATEPLFECISADVLPHSHLLLKCCFPSCRTRRLPTPTPAMSCKLTFETTVLPKERAFPVVTTSKPWDKVRPCLIALRRQGILPGGPGHGGGGHRSVAFCCAVLCCHQDRWRLLSTEREKCFLYFCLNTHLQLPAAKEGVTGLLQTDLPSAATR